MIHNSNDPRSFSIFPRNTKDYHEHCHPTSYPLKDVFDSLTVSYDPSTGLSDIVVTSAAFCKQETGSKREFVRLTVEDKQAGGMRKDVVIERKKVDRLVVPSSCETHTLDSQYLPYAELASFDFTTEKKTDPTECPSFVQLIAISREVSIYQKKSHLLLGRSSRFASLIWDTINHLYLDETRSQTNGERQGRFSIFSQKNTYATDLEFIVQAVNTFTQNWKPEQTKSHMV